MPEKEKKLVDPLAEAKNIEDRIKTEQQAPKQWAHNWGGIFPSTLPHKYEERIDYLKDHLNQMPGGEQPAKYGAGRSIKDIRINDYRRKKYEANPVED